MRINPLLSKEMRLEMRTWRTFIMLSLYLLALGGFGTIFFISMSRGLNMGYTDSAQLGRSMFTFMAVLQFVLIVLLVPSLTANAISAEKQSQTFDLLVCTQLTPVGIILGKLAASLSTVFLLIVASLPLYGFIFLLGGVSPGELFILLMILMVNALFLGSVTVLFSARFKKTSAAFIAAYGLCLFLYGATAILNAFNQSFIYMGTAPPAHILLMMNPLILFEWLYPEPLKEMLHHLSQNNYPFRTLSWLRYWHINLIFTGFLATVSLVWASRLVNPLRADRKR
jgi:ABC-type transport system involved in multi-copper enzyme maturation permease subunit